MADIAIKLNLNEDNQPIFHTNETLTGIVEVSLSDSTLVTCLTIVVNGYGRTHWKEPKTVSSNGREETINTNYEGKEEYLNTSMNLLGEPGGHSIELSAGVHRYNISVPLRDSLPSSYIADEYEINYCVTAILDIPKKVIKNVKEYFTVIERVGVSTYPDLLDPVKYETIKNFCCCFCKSEPLMISVSIPYSLFLVGHAIPIKFKYVNKSDGAIAETLIRLIRKIKCEASTPKSKTKIDKEIVAAKIERGIGAKSEIEFETLLDLPANMPPTTNKHCKIISIIYKLKFEIKTVGIHLDEYIEFYVTIMDAKNQITTNISPVPSFMPTAPRDENNDDLPPSFNTLNSQYAPLIAQNENLGWNVPTTSSE